MIVLSTGRMLELQLIGDKDAKRDQLIVEVTSLAGSGWAGPYGDALQVGQSVLTGYESI